MVSEWLTSGFEGVHIAKFWISTSKRQSTSEDEFWRSILYWKGQGPWLKGETKEQYIGRKISEK